MASYQTKEEWSLVSLQGQLRLINMARVRFRASDGRILEFFDKLGLESAGCDEAQGAEGRRPSLGPYSRQNWRHIQECPTVSSGSASQISWRHGNWMLVRRASVGDMANSKVLLKTVSIHVAGGHKRERARECPGRDEGKRASGKKLHGSGST